MAEANTTLASRGIFLVDLAIGHTGKVRELGPSSVPMVPWPSPIISLKTGWDLLHKELLGKIHEYDKTLYFNSKSSQHGLMGERGETAYFIKWKGIVTQETILKIMLFSGNWMYFIMLSKISQSQNDEYCIFSPTCRS